ncbi:MAG: CDP-alcohol phosphatidyltransferase family protein [Olsenella sp.]|nr:CDP-alcohol phosphatidyltransferase family protein [Olsenella sp.]MCH4119341.1 CDP-alcohol phosphatidyltransferase family protein [Atopobiaceae bacterium]MCI1288466.1 CDP-alcohol phosphatidyltransferase family protein [Olsenella sp.]
MGTKREKFETSIKNQVGRDAALAQEHGTTAPVGTSNNPSHKIFTIANVITLCRFVLTAIFLYMFVNDINRYLALTFYVIAAVTDFLDGQVARRTQTVSWLGKIMDPVMDRVLLFTGVLGLILTGELPVWTAIFVIGRDIYLFIGSMILQKYQRRPVDVVYVGKFATAFLMTGFSFLLLGLPRVHGLNMVEVSWLPGLGRESAPLGIFFVYAGLLCSLAAALVYTKRGFAIKRRALALGHRTDEAADAAAVEAADAVAEAAHAGEKDARSKAKAGVPGAPEAD